jgi:preprotein translocase subunit SecE
MPETKTAVKKEKDGKKRIEGLKRFLTETRAELKKIVWPTPKQVLNNTLVVLVAILVIGAFIWCIDALSSLGLSTILKNY